LTEDAEEGPKDTFVAMIEWQVQLTWFELDSRTRADYALQLREIVSRYPEVRFRWFDAEAWTGKFTDFALCEFEDLDSYNRLWGDLRRHPFLSTPFAIASRVLMGRKLEPPPPPPPEIDCPHCGHKVRSSARFCGACGRSPKFVPPADA
jgi:hypothetical protein